MDRNQIQAGLRHQDSLFREILAHFKKRGVEGYQIKALGVTMGFSEFSHVILHHESNHHGLWSMYATQGEFSTPKSWVDSWGL